MLFFILRVLWCVQFLGIVVSTAITAYSTVASNVFNADNFTNALEGIAVSALLILLTGVFIIAVELLLLIVVNLFYVLSIAGCEATAAFLAIEKSVRTTSTNAT